MRLSIKHIYAALALLPLTTLAQTTAPATTQPWQPDPKIERRMAKSFPAQTFDETKVRPYTLPPIFTDDTTKETWPQRRREIVDLFAKHVFGHPPATPDRIAFKVLESDPKAMAGRATLKRIEITSTRHDRSHSFTLTLFTPNKKTRPAAAFLLINNRPPENVDPTRQTKSDFWPAEQVIDRGYAIAAFNNREIAPDVKATWHTGLIAAWDSAATSRPADPHAGKAISAWAWGASRCMDYLQTDPDVDANHVAVVGHSRGGKTALWAGALDERFAMVVSNDSGEGGASLALRNYGEDVAILNHNFPHWFCETYRTYGPDPSTMPVDQHMLLAAVAPRVLCVGSAADDVWADPRGEYAALAASNPAFELFGDPRLDPAAMPAVDRPVNTPHRHYHIRPGIHNLTPKDWSYYMDVADRVWPRP